MHRRSVPGFTLIELAVVLAVVSLLAAGAVTSFSAIRTNTKIRETQAAFDRAELLLEAFVARNGRLPCPADPTISQGAGGYGQESNDGGFYGTANAGVGCDSPREMVGGFEIYWGTLPAASLGARVQDVTDGWDTQIFYYVNVRATLTDSLVSGRWSKNDTMTLWPNTAMNPGDAITSAGVVTLVSVGADRNGGYTLDGQSLPAPPLGAVAERENVDFNDFDFVVTDYSDDPDAPFDDFVRVYREDDLVLPLALIGDIKTKRALTLERMDRLVDAIYGHAAADPTNHEVPDNADDSGTEASVGTGFPWADLGLADSDVKNAYGEWLTYSVDAVREICAPDNVALATDTLFTLSSPGPDASTVSVTRGEAVGRLIAAGITPNACP